MDVRYIYKLEKHYHRVLSEILFSNEVISSIKKLEKTSIEDRKEIKEKWLQTNTIETLLERLVRFYIYGMGAKKLNIIDAYHSPLSSDVAFETVDAIIFIDTKTIDKKSNPGDINSIPFKPNQITFKNKPLYGGEHKSLDNDEVFHFSGTNFPNNSTKITKNGIYRNKKPILTFIFGLHYLSSKNLITSTLFEEREMYLASMPHYFVADEYFENDIISNFKSYDYIDSDNEYKKYPNYKPFKNASNKTLIPFKPNPEGRGAIFYFEPGKKSPLFNNSDLLWGKPKKEKHKLYDFFLAVLYGSAARTLKTKFTENPDEKWRLKQYFFD